MKFLAKKKLIKDVKLFPTIQNVVATVSFERSFNLEKIAKVTRGIYEPEQFPGLILKIETPHRASVLIFASGKMVITGLKSSEQIEPVVLSLKEIIDEIE